MEPSSINKSVIPGVLTKFKIFELSGVDKGAQEGATVAIIKSATPREANLDRYSAEAMRARGVATMANPEDLEDPPPELGPGESINWTKSAAAHHAEITDMAKDRAKASGCSFERAYSEILAEHPHAARRMIQG